jgi:hypothetical protein
MMKAKEAGYSRIYHTNRDKRFGFRYNYDTAELEWVSKWDCKIGTDRELHDIDLPDWKITDSTSLSRENWEDNPQYWVDMYQNEIDEECAAAI